MNSLHHQQLNNHYRVVLTRLMLGTAASAGLSLIMVDYFADLSHSTALNFALAVLFVIVAGSGMFLWLRPALSRIERSAAASLRQQEGVQSLILNQMPAIVWVEDENRKILFMNDYWYEFTGIDRSADQDAAAQLSVHPEDLERILPALVRAREKGVATTLECRVKDRHGNYRDTYFQIAPVKDDLGKTIRWIGVNRDITELKNYERRLRSLNDELEKIVLERTRELQRSNEELKQFALIVSHDLQTPINTVYSYIDLLANHVKDHADEKMKRYIEAGQRGCLEAKALVSDLLNYSQVCYNKPTVLPVDLTEVLRRVQERLKDEIELAEARIEIHPLPIVLASSGLMDQVFQNLLQNALKFRKRDTPSIIKISSREDESSWVISVEDNGIGVNPKFRNTIFQIFERLHPASQYPGRGIGLSTCKKIVEYHGGRIWVEEGMDGGSRFVFSLAKSGTAPSI